MEEKKSQKSNKNLYLPLWVSEVLDIEGEKYDGPGEVAAAAIVAFVSLLDDQKKVVFSTYRAKQIEAMHRDQALEKKEIETAFDDDDAEQVDEIVSDSEADTAKQKQKRGRKSSNTG